MRPAFSPLINLGINHREVAGVRRKGLLLSARCRQRNSSFPFRIHRPRESKSGGNYVTMDGEVIRKAFSESRANIIDIESH
jgi:hypothetical protein